MTSLRAFSDEVPLSMRLERAVLILLRLLSRFLIYVTRVLSPVKKEDPFVVTFPFKRSSIRIAVEQPRWLIAGPKVLTLEMPIL